MDSKLKNNAPYFATKTYQTIETLYDETNQGSSPLFPGGFINFGYWKQLNLEKELSFQNRIQSQANLYAHVLNKLDVRPEDALLEIGSGLGMGTLYTFEHYKPKTLIGLDSSNAQVTRAVTNKQKMHDNQAIDFIHGAAESLPFTAHMFNTVFSIEAAQHFQSMAHFMSEAHRVLVPNGKIGITTYFAQSTDSIAILKPQIPIIEAEIDKICTITQIFDTLITHKFKNISVESIGKHVFSGFDKWLEQMPEFGQHWGRNWLTAYNQSLLDYYVITAQK